MSRQLLLMRHGKSDWDVDTDDFNRPLKKRGKKGARLIGHWLRQQNLLADFIISSPAERAVSTAKRLKQAAGQKKQPLYLDQRIYAAGVKDLEKVLSDCPDQYNRVLMIGHNPGLEDLLCHLSNSAHIPDDGKLIPTATLAILKMPDNWQQLGKGCARIISITRASSLT